MGMTVSDTQNIPFMHIDICKSQYIKLETRRGTERQIEVWEDPLKHNQVVLNTFCPILCQENKKNVV